MSPDLSCPWLTSLLGRSTTDEDLDPVTEVAVPSCCGDRQHLINLQHKTELKNSDMTMKAHPGGFPVTCNIRF